MSGLAGARFHLIGHLQSNKSSRAAELFQVIQTVDSIRLARRLDAAGAKLDVMLEVKLSPEEGKSGAAPDDAAGLIAAVRACSNLRLLGLDDHAAVVGRCRGSRPYFRRLRELAQDARVDAAFHGHVARPGRPPSKKAPPAYGWERRCSGDGRRRDRGLLFAAAAGPHRRGRLRGCPAGGVAPARARLPIAPRRCDVALYHLGNNALHAAIYRRALARPGVVVLHDAVLHHFLLGQLGEAAYIEEFVYNYGEWSRDLARELWRGPRGFGRGQPLFRVPHAAAHRRSGRARWWCTIRRRRKQCGSTRRRARVIEIPHLFQPPELPPLAEMLRFRDRLGVPQASFLFGVFGYLRESKRLASVLEAFAEVHRELPATALLVAGQFVSSDLERAVAPLVAAPGVARLPYLPERDFWLAARSGGCLHQPALSGGGRSVGHRHPADGDRQARADHRWPGERGASRRTPASAWRPAWASATPCGST